LWLADLWNRRAAADFAGKQIRDLCMPRDRFGLAGFRIAPQGMSSAFTLEITTVKAELAKKRFALH
jgi:hypothetical protein